MSNRHFLSTGLAAMVVVTFLAACSGGAAAPSSATSGNSGGPPAGAGAGTGTEAGASGCANPIGDAVGSAGGPYASVLGAALCGIANIQPCSMLKQEDVQALFSVPLATTKSDLMGKCTWPLSDPDKGDGLDVFVNVGEGEGSLDDDMGPSGDTTPVSGIGDRARWDLLGGYFPHLGAVKGQATCEVSIAGGNGQTSVHTTGKGVFAKIDDAALPGFMQQLGGLCNEIFAGLGA
jgi:hypothetical protein